MRYIDPDGRAVAQPDDWVRTANGSVVHDAAVTDKSNAQERYGAQAQYLGASAVYQNASGDQISLNENGRITEASFLGTLEVTASRTGDALGTADNVASALGLSIDGTDGIVQASIGLAGASTGDYSQGLGTLGKATEFLGKASGIVGAVKSGSDFYNNPSLGNGVKLAYDITTTVAKLNPVAGIIIGAIDVSGLKDQAATVINRGAENFSYNNWLDSQTIQ